MYCFNQTILLSFRSFTFQQATHSLSSQLSNFLFYRLVSAWVTCVYLFAMICGISCTCQVLIGPTIKVKVLSTHDTISSIASTAFTLVHGLSDVTEEDTLRVFIAAVAVVLTRVVRFTNLYNKGTQNSASKTTYTHIYVR